MIRIYFINVVVCLLLSWSFCNSPCYAGIFDNIQRREERAMEDTRIKEPEQPQIEVQKAREQTELEQKKANELSNAKQEAQSLIVEVKFKLHKTKEYEHKDVVLSCISELESTLETEDVEKIKIKTKELAMYNQDLDDYINKTLIENQNNLEQNVDNNDE